MQLPCKTKVLAFTSWWQHGASLLLWKSPNPPNSLWLKDMMPFLKLEKTTCFSFIILVTHQPCLQINLLGRDSGYSGQVMVKMELTGRRKTGRPPRIFVDVVNVQRSCDSRAEATPQRWMPITPQGTDSFIKVSSFIFAITADTTGGSAVSDVKLLQKPLWVQLMVHLSYTAWCCTPDSRVQLGLCAQHISSLPV